MFYILIKNKEALLNVIKVSDRLWDMREKHIKYSAKKRQPDFFFNIIS